MREYGINTGLRLPRSQYEKLDQMAKAFRISRNKMVGLLIDTAEVQSQPAVSVGLQKNTRNDVCSGQVQNVKAGGA